MGHCSVRTLNFLQNMMANYWRINSRVQYGLTYRFKASPSAPIRRSDGRVTKIRARRTGRMRTGERREHPDHLD